MQPRNVLAPGVPLINEDAQGIQRIGTAGCIVKDGERYYVLTNRHVAGPEGTRISALNGHRSVEVGTTSEKGITRLAFKDVYPHFTSTFQYLLMDVGLVEVFDIQRWTTQFSEIAPVDNVLDLYDNSFSLHLIGMNVVGLGAVSGLIRGEIHGLFYRYKSIGGYEYLADFLIGPETTVPAEAPDAEPALSVLHGDSGALLFIEYIGDEKAAMPLLPVRHSVGQTRVRGRWRPDRTAVRPGHRTEHDARTPESRSCSRSQCRRRTHMGVGRPLRHRQHPAGNDQTADRTGGAEPR